MNEVTSGEPLLVVNFDKMPDDEYNELNQRIQKLKLDELVDDDEDDDEDGDDFTEQVFNGAVQLVERCLGSRGRR